MPESALGLRDHGQAYLRYAEREEACEAGDAYFAPPGHTHRDAGTEVVEFRPTEVSARTREVLAHSVAASQETS